MLRKQIFFFSILSALFLNLSSCGTNPVTGKNELQVVSEAQEIQIGQEYYSYLKQVEGGDYTADPRLAEYVANVGKKLAAVSDRPQLPYEFSILDNTIPNAWALPGGKISVNIGLLVNLSNEAELAAVIAHEIVHSAARHGAQAMQRAILLQTGLIGLSKAVDGQVYEGAVMQGADLGANLITTKYSRSAELEADKYGIKYMEKAGYDPQAAVTLQEMFVKLQEEQEKPWVNGLFATHPPSEDRVKANETNVAMYPKQGFLGEKEYKAAIAELLKTKPAYDAMDRGYKLLLRGDPKAALAQAEKAIGIESKEGHFYNLQGKAFVALHRYSEAMLSFDKAIETNANYFDYYLQRGLLKKQLGLNALQDLEKSFKLLPTKEAHDAMEGSLTPSS